MAIIRSFLAIVPHLLAGAVCFYVQGGNDPFLDEDDEAVYDGRIFYYFQLFAL